MDKGTKDAVGFQNEIRASEEKTGTTHPIQLLSLHSFENFER